MERSPNKKMIARLILVIFVFFLCFVIISYSVFSLTVRENETYTALANSQVLKSEVIPASRGTIYDRNMQTLAASATVWDVVLTPANIVDESEEKKAYIADGLYKILKLVDSTITAESISAKIETGYIYAALTSKIEKSYADLISEFILNGYTSEEGKTSYINGISLVENTKRYYPNGAFASSVIGFTGSDSQGLYGIEYQYDQILSGQPGYVLSEKNALSQDMPGGYQERYEPVDGSNIVLTIDETIQHFVEKTLDQIMIEFDPDMGATAIVMNVNTGEILAMGNRPTYDLNEPFTIYDEDWIAILAELEGEDEYSATRASYQTSQWSNKAISYIYQPGSTFKTVTAAAALEEKTASMHDEFYCPGYIIVADRIMNCHTYYAGGYGHGVIDYTGAMVGSCNPAFVEIAQNLGADNFFKYFELFGLTTKTGIDLPGESNSSFYTADKLGIVELSSSSFGQSMAVTPIQLLTAFSATVNGGYLVTPYVVKEIRDSNNNLISSTQTTIVRQAISESTSDYLKEILESVVNEKGGTNASIKGYRIGGKSGTSQKQNPGDSEDARIASYVAVAPADNPEIAVYVMVDEPTQFTSSYGSVIAAPSVASIMKDTLEYLGYSPQYSQEEIETMEVATPYIIEKTLDEAIVKLEESGIVNYKVYGSGDVVTSQMPTPGTPVSKDGTVYIYTDDASLAMGTMISVVGSKPLDAKAKLEALGYNVSFTSDAYEHTLAIVTEQSVIEGVSEPLGSIIELKCVAQDNNG